MPLTLSVTEPDGVSAGTNAQLRAGSTASLSVNVRTETPGEYVIVVRAVADDGTSDEATHTIIITDPAAPAATTTTVASTTQPPSAQPARVLVDDFEGADQWVETVTFTTNGSSSSSEQS